MPWRCLVHCGLRASVLRICVAGAAIGALASSGVVLWLRGSVFGILWQAWHLGLLLGICVAGVALGDMDLTLCGRRRTW